MRTSSVVSRGRGLVSHSEPGSAATAFRSGSPLRGSHRSRPIFHRPVVSVRRDEPAAAIPVKEIVQPPGAAPDVWSAQVERDSCALAKEQRELVERCGSSERDRSHAALARLDINPPAVREIDVGGCSGHAHGSGKKIGADHRSYSACHARSSVGNCSASGRRIGTPVDVALRASWYKYGNSS